MMAGENGTAGRGNSQAVAIAELSQQMRSWGAALIELKEMVRELTDKVTALERREIEQQTRLQYQVAQHDEDLVALKAWREQAERLLGRLGSEHRILVWVASAFGASIVALIWALITGQATVVFK